MRTVCRWHEELCKSSTWWWTFTFASFHSIAMSVSSAGIMKCWNKTQTANASKREWWKSGAHLKNFDLFTRICTAYIAHNIPTLRSIRSCANRTEHSMHSSLLFSMKRKQNELHYHLCVSWHLTFSDSFSRSRTCLPPTHPPFQIVVILREWDWEYLGCSNNITTIFHTNYKWKILEYLE